MKIRFALCFISALLISQLTFADGICADIDLLWKQANTGFSEIRGPMTGMEPFERPPGFQGPGTYYEAYQCKQLLPGAIGCEINLGKLDQAYQGHPKGSLEGAGYSSVWKDDGKFNELVEQIRGCGYQLQKKGETKSGERWRWNSGEPNPVKSITVKIYKGEISLLLNYLLIDTRNP